MKKPTKRQIDKVFVKAAKELHKSLNLLTKKVVDQIEIDKKLKNKIFFDKVEERLVIEFAFYRNIKKKVKTTPIPTEIIDG
jgi:hypothetical protein